MNKLIVLATTAIVVSLSMSAYSAGDPPVKGKGKMANEWSVVSSENSAGAQESVIKCQVPPCGGTFSFPKPFGKLKVGNGNGVEENDPNFRWPWQKKTEERLKFVGS